MKLGRWFYCKYCYKSIRPELGPDGSIIICPKCGSGLGPVDAVAKAGSLDAWHEKIVRDFIKATGKRNAVAD